MCILDTELSCEQIVFYLLCFVCDRMFLTICCTSTWCQYVAGHLFAGLSVFSHLYKWSQSKLVENNLRQVINIIDCCTVWCYSAENIAVINCVLYLSISQKCVGCITGRYWIPGGVHCKREINWLLFSEHLEWGLKVGPYRKNVLFCHSRKFF